MLMEYINIECCVTEDAMQKLNQTVHKCETFWVFPHFLTPLFMEPFFL